MANEEETRNVAATAILANTVKLKNCSIRVNVGGFSKIFSSAGSLPVGMAILAVVCAIMFTYWTSIKPSNGYGIFAALDAADHSVDMSKDRKRDATPSPSKVGTKVCQETRPSWKHVTGTLMRVEPFAPETVKYGEERFICVARSPRMRRFRGRCEDLTTGKISICIGHPDPTTAVRHAAAQLIRTMVSLRKYESPYDVRDMPTECIPPTIPRHDRRKAHTLY